MSDEFDSFTEDALLSDAPDEPDAEASWRARDERLADEREERAELQADDDAAEAFYDKHFAQIEDALDAEVDEKRLQRLEREASRDAHKDAERIRREILESEGA